MSVSFLSRFNIIGNKKSDQSEEADGDESEPPEGMNAHVFSSSIGAIGYIPQHKDPTYIKVRAHHKKEREFTRMFLAQELKGNSRDTTSDATADTSPKKNKAQNSIWCTDFSRDGKYLAAAGHDHIVRVWAVISTPDDRRKHENEEDARDRSSGGQGERLSAPVFRGKPIHEFEGHTSDVLDLSWSKNNFLLSSSMDKTVRLWHISREECLCTFKHRDFVTSIAFHPKDDRFFLAGSLDSTLRLWSIPDKSVAFSQQLPGLITAVGFTPDGKTAMAGIITGLCLFYETEGLKYHTQIHVRSSRGRNAKGSKITGIRTLTYPPDDPDGDLKLLITTNDSRVRLYNFRDKSLEMKFKGNSNSSSQIHASFSDDGKHIICGSEDKRTYIWSTSAVDAEMKDKRPLEDFAAHQEIVTTAIFAPTKTRQLLSASGDPLYDLCNPPPVTLLSREESHTTKSPPEESENAETVKKQEETPAYIERSLHRDGNIIVTSDFTGNIKVFRQDCAFKQRRNDQWETASTFSRKLGESMLGRSASIRTKNSDRSQIRSRRNSVATQHNGTNHSESRILSWRNSIGSNVSVDSSIRNGIVGGTPANGYINASARSERSLSPGKFSTGATTLTESRTSVHSQALGGSSAKEARQLPYVNGTIGSGRGTPSIATKSTRSSSPPPTRGSSGPANSIKSKGKDAGRGGSKQTTLPPVPTIQKPPTPSFSISRAPTTSSIPTSNQNAPAKAPSDDESDKTANQNSLKIDPMGRSYNFWNKNSWTRGSANSSTSSVARPETSGGLLGTGILGFGGSKLEKTRTAASRLSSDDDADAMGFNVRSREGSKSEDAEAEAKLGSAVEADEEVKCKRCGGKEFRARKVIANPGGGTGQKLVCGRCGLICE